MDEKQKQFIDIRKKSIRDKNSREYQDLSSEDPFSIGWIRNHNGPRIVCLYCVMMSRFTYIT